MIYYYTKSVFRQQVVYVPLLRQLLVKHIVDMPAPVITGRTMGSLAGAAGLAGVGGLAGRRGGIAG